MKGKLMKPQSLQKSSRKRHERRVRNRPGRKLVRFANMKGRTVEAIELDTSSDHHSVSVRFEDKTELWLILETGFTVRAQHVDLKGDDSRVLKEWPEIRSEP